MPGNPIQSGEAIRFQFEGSPIEGFTSEPLAVALLAAGIRVFGRSIKYHRARAPVCLHGHCSGCLMRVDGVPNVRSCHSLCRSGMVVERQGGWPSTRLDALRGVDWLTADGLQHHGMFTASATVNRLASYFVRRLSSMGEPPTTDPPEPVHFSRVQAPVVVVGAGAAGLHAASALAASGHRVVLLESEGHLGGRLLDRSCSPEASRSGWDFLAEEKKKVEAAEEIEVHVNMPVLAVYPGDPLQVVAASDHQCLQIEASRLLFCTGAYEQVPLFTNNDLPGVFGIRALDRLVCGYGVLPAEPVALVGDSDRALNLAVRLAEQGVSLSGVITSCSDDARVAELGKHNVPVFGARQLAQASGGRWLNRLEFAPPGSDVPDLVLDCKVCAAEAPESPAYELAHHAGCRVTFQSDSGYLVWSNEKGHTSHSQIFAAGHCTGATSVRQAIGQGEIAGLACALSLKDDPRTSGRLGDLLASMDKH